MTAAITLPPVTDAHRRAAFERLRMTGWTYDAARADPLRRRVIEACATQLRTKEWQAQHQRTTQLVRRCHPITGQWVTQRVPGFYEPNQRSVGAE